MNAGRLVLHGGPGRRWFEHRGVRYDVIQGGQGWGYSVHGPSGTVVADGYFTLAEVRERVRRDLDARPASPDDFNPPTRVEWGVRDAHGRGKGNFHEDRAAAEKWLREFPDGRLIRRVVSDWHDYEAGA